MGWEHLQPVMQRYAVAEGAYLVGLAQMDFEISVDYAKERVQFGRPIGSFQAIQHKCADMVTDVDGSRFIMYKAAWSINTDQDDTQMAVNMAKAWTSEATRRVVGPRPADPRRHRLHEGLQDPALLPPSEACGAGVGRHGPPPRARRRPARHLAAPTGLRRRRAARKGGPLRCVRGFQSHVGGLICGRKDRVVMQDRRDEAAGVLTEVVDALTSSGANLELALRRYAYACELAGFASEAHWAWAELSGYATPEDAPDYRNSAATLRWQADSSLTPFERIDAASSAAVYEHPGPDELSSEVLFVGVPDLLQASKTGYWEKTGEMKTVRGGRRSYGGHPFERVRVVEPPHIVATLGRIERVLLRRAIASRIAMVYGSAVEEVWSRLRSQVEPRLLAIGLTDHLETIERELSADTNAGRQSAMYGCRSLLTALADHVWRDERPTYAPLRGDGPGGKLVVTADRSKNRLAAYLHYSSGGSSAEDYLQAEVERVWDSTTKLIDLANKAHDVDVSHEDAELVVVGTYVLLGELGRRTQFAPVENYDAQPAESGSR